MINELNFKKIKFKDIDSKLIVLDNFCEFYGWQILNLKNQYIIYDLQTGEIVDNTIYWKDSLIDRVSSRALEYEINEHEFEDYNIDRGIYIYYIKLLTIYCLYGNIERNKEWFLDIKNTFKKFEIEKESGSDESNI